LQQRYSFSLRGNSSPENKTGTADNYDHAKMEQTKSAITVNPVLKNDKKQF
jgi:hypothetical protein